MKYLVDALLRVSDRFYIRVQLHLNFIKNYYFVHFSLDPIILSSHQRSYEVRGPPFLQFEACWFLPALSFLHVLMLQFFTPRPAIVLIRILTQIFIALVIFLVSCHIKLLILQPWGLGICKLVLGCSIHVLLYYLMHNLMWSHFVTF